MEPGQHVVAVAAFIFDRGRVLCLRRAHHKDAGAGQWETLSGRVEAGEEPLDAVRREIREESGLEVDLDPRPFEAYPARRGTAPLIVIVYLARYLGGQVRLSDEHSDFAWLTPRELAARSPFARLSDSVQRAARALEAQDRV